MKAEHESGSADPKARAMIAAAVARGWLAPADAFDIGWRLKGQASTVERALGSHLTGEQIDILARESEPGQSATTRVAGATTTVSLAPAEISAALAELSAPAGTISGARYVAIAPMGHGGGGRVVSSMDRELGRRVAVKIPHEDDESQLARFLFEARVTARLEHPNIVPVYDFGVLPDGSPFYAMRAAEPRSLRDALRDSPWPRVRLLGMFTQVARALAYAHARGVLHGDVKPSNILLGDYGEVYLADWGLARVRDERAFEPTREPLSFAPLEVGTLGYLAPEVYAQRPVDQRTDLFALGVVLYETLTRQHPFHGDDEAEIIAAVCLTDPERPSAVAADCPLLLDDLCMELLAKAPDGRPNTADEVAERVEAFLEGAKEHQRRCDEARRLCDQAREPSVQLEALDENRQRHAAEAQRLLQTIESWEPVEQKRPAWSAEQHAEQADREGARKLAEAMELYTQALGYDPACEQAHQGLAELYLAQAKRAAEERRTATRIHYETLALRHDVGGQCAELLSAPAGLSLITNPPGAQATLYRYEERDRRLVCGDPRPIGVTPLEANGLGPGSHLVVLRKAGFRDVRVPLLLERGQRSELDINLYRDDQIGEGFVYIPGGPARIGGDPDAPTSLPGQTVTVPDFAIQTFPVTVREYCDYLEALEAESSDEARRRAPYRLVDAQADAVTRSNNGTWSPCDQLIEGEARRHFPPEDGHFWRVPIMLVRWFDALAYCRWRSERDAVPCRLPTEVEWEKTARGVDGRFFPWGDAFDSSFCLIRGSRPYTSQPEPIGTFPADESPYGVRDMAGGMREWVADVFARRSAAECANDPEPSGETDRSSTMRMIRGGLWHGTSPYSRCAARGPMYAAMRGLALSFRLATSLCKT